MNSLRPTRRIKKVIREQYELSALNTISITIFMLSFVQGLVSGPVCGGFANIRISVNSAFNRALGRGQYECSKYSK